MGTEVEERVVPPTAAFSCVLCGEAAGWAMLLNPGVLNPDPGDAPPGVAEMFADEPRVLYSATLNRVESPISAESAEQLEAAIAEHNARKIWRASGKDALPFYCPECDKMYCPSHWDVEIEMDDSMPNQIEDITGTCPAGHWKLLEDRPM